MLTVEETRKENREEIEVTSQPRKKKKNTEVTEEVDPSLQLQLLVMSVIDGQYQNNKNVTICS